MKKQTNRTIEFEFVLQCVRPPDNINLKKIKEICSEPLDWDRTCQIASNHRLMPLFYKNIKHLIPNDPPNYILENLKDAFKKNAFRNTYYCSSLFKILDLLYKNNIDAVPFKGPVLSKDLYGSIDLRQFSDIDIIVKKEDALKCWNIFIEKEMTPELILDDSQKQKYIKTEDHMSFSNQGVYVEIHWELSGEYLSKPIRYQNISSKLRTISLLNYDIKTFSEETLLVYLCVHGNKHGWEALEMICCIDWLMQTRQIDWQQVKKIQISWKCEKMTLLALCLCNLLFGTPLPADISQKINESSDLEQIAQDTITAITSNHPGSDRFSFFHIHIKDSLTDKIRYIMRLLFMATSKEWLYFPVPSYLSFLHFILRPIRLLTLMFNK